MDLNKIKNLIKQNGDRLILLENGEPEAVVMSFPEYERLTSGVKPISAILRERTSQKMQVELSDLEMGRLPETEFVLPSLNDVSRTPLRLEDIRLEDLPI
mgnify:CR=1 FL=1